MAPPPLPLELINDVTAEILLRLPPDEPEHLVRASAVCKPWLRVVCDPGFLRRYRAFHGAPPLLGLLHSLQVLQGDPGSRFASITALPAFPHPGADLADNSGARALDCRHGRTLFRMREDENEFFLVWDPVTGDRHILPPPDINWLVFSAAVLCATDGCDHLDCHGVPFRVVFVATDEYEDVVKASMFSSETGVWSAPVSLGNECQCYVEHKKHAVANSRRGRFYTPYVQPRRAALVEDEICCTIRWDNSIVKYDLGKNCLSMIKPPPHSSYYIALMEMEDGALGFAWIEDSSLYLWSRKADSIGVAEWVQRKVIELKGIAPAAGPDEKAVVGWLRR
ncbi:hypothetical protein QOZ80_7BG0585520 [Eleusine coracana subsp. coracana]|nr:hypothetical protein QOZ80_7BG0585520 [Eleusine coracana subsp. coracana]